MFPEALVKLPGRFETGTNDKEVAEVECRLAWSRPETAVFERFKTRAGAGDGRPGESLKPSGE